LQIDLNYITTYLFNTQKQIKEVGWFRNALYLFLLYKVFVYLFQFKALFSEQRFIYHHVKHINPVVDSVFFLNNHYSVLLALVFIFSVGILSIIGLLKKSNYITKPYFVAIGNEFNQLFVPNLNRWRLFIKSIIVF
jgi:hypothetical protein